MAFHEASTGMWFGQTCSKNRLARSMPFSSMKVLDQFLKELFCFMVNVAYGYIDARISSFSDSFRTLSKLPNMDALTAPAAREIVAFISAVADRAWERFEKE